MANLGPLDSGKAGSESFMMCMSLPVVLACYLDSGETRIIKIHIAKKNTENLKNRNVLYMQKFLALRYRHKILHQINDYSHQALVSHLK